VMLWAASSLRCARHSKNWACAPRVPRRVFKVLETWPTKADQCAYTYRKSEGINLSQLLAITDHFGGISKARAKELGYEVLQGEAWIERHSQ
jgi:hypothetical protein